MFISLLTPFFIINFTGSYKKECILKLILDVKTETTAEEHRIMLKAVLMPFCIIKRNSFGWVYGLICYELLQEAVRRRSLVM